MTGDTFNMSGDFRGAIINIKSTLTQVRQAVSAIPGADESAKKDLQVLVERLSEALEGTPPDKVEEAEAVAEQAKRVIEEAQAEKPNRPLLRVSGEGLKEAARALAEVVPTALTIATQIVAAIGRHAGL